MEASALQAPQGPSRLAARGPLLRLRSDEQLVALFRRGHDEAFQVIFDRYRQRVFAYTRQMLAGSRSDAEDALQFVDGEPSHPELQDALTHFPRNVSVGFQTEVNLAGRHWIRDVAGKLERGWVLAIAHSPEKSE